MRCHKSRWFMLLVIQLEAKTCVSYYLVVAHGGLLENNIQETITYPLFILRVPTNR